MYIYIDSMYVCIYMYVCFVCSDLAYKISGSDPDYILDNAALIVMSGPDQVMKQVCLTVITKA